MLSACYCKLWCPEAEYLGNKHAILSLSRGLIITGLLEWCNKVWSRSCLAIKSFRGLRKKWRPGEKSLCIYSPTLGDFLFITQEPNNIGCFITIKFKVLCIQSGHSTWVLCVDYPYNRSRPPDHYKMTIIEWRMTFYPSRSVLLESAICWKYLFTAISFYHTLNWPYFKEKPFKATRERELNTKLQMTEEISLTKEHRRINSVFHHVLIRLLYSCIS